MDYEILPNFVEHRKKILNTRSQRQNFIREIKKRPIILVCEIMFSAMLPKATIHPFQFS